MKTSHPSYTNITLYSNFRKSQDVIRSRALMKNQLDTKYRQNISKAESWLEVKKLNPSIQIPQTLPREKKLYTDTRPRRPRVTLLPIIKPKLNKNKPKELELFIGAKPEKNPQKNNINTGQFNPHLIRKFESPKS
jgi:hypothetical protein